MGAMLLWPGAAFAGQREAVILGRAFAYDYNLHTHAGSSLVLAVVYNPHDSDSVASGSRWYDDFQALAGVKIQGMPLKVIRLAYASPSQLQSAVQSQGIDILFICGGLEDSVGTITSTSHSGKVLTVGATDALVRAGLALGVFSDDGQVKILVNLPAAGKEGVSFSSDLLRLAQIIR